MNWKLPEHIAIIMDGNGRWATQRGLPRKEGHKRGSETIISLMDIALEIGLKNISLYAFSTENWKRPITEVHAIFNLLDTFIEERLEEIHSKNVRIWHSGSPKKIPSKSYKKIQNAMKTTAKNKKLNINFCLNYGSHEEILNAFHRIQEKRKKNGKSLEKEISKKELEENLYTYPLPEVDLMIRTGGESRISNFLLWQVAYAELYFTDTLWPDFNRESLVSALDWYSGRIRKFGGLHE